MADWDWRRDRRFHPRIARRTFAALHHRTAPSALRDNAMLPSRRTGRRTPGTLLVRSTCYEVTVTDTLSGYSLCRLRAKSAGSVSNVSFSYCTSAEDGTYGEAVSR